MNKASEVRLINLGKKFGEVEAVKDVNLTIERGDFFTFLGPSGCGKTTLLRMIAGFTRPDQGTILFDGVEVNDIPPWKRDVGMVFQSYALWPHLSVFENVAFGLKERNLPKAVVQEKTLRALSMVNLEGLERRRPSELSGGQQQRVALARTLVIEPRLLLLDEPLSNLDAKLRIQMRQELVRIQRDLGITSIYVTHDQEEALTLSTRIAVMSKGHVVQVGSPKEIYENPKSQEVADFVGTSNFFSGSVVEELKDKLRVRTEEGVMLAVERQPELPLGIGSNLLLNIRPESFRISDADEVSSGENRVEGVVKTSAYLGSLVQYEVEVSGGKRVKVNLVNPRKKSLLREGERVSLTFSSEDVIAIPFGR
ncbi:MAG: ABC transporter ATP-binding protein [Syntrophaceae bacterium]|nr:ABC transporter ATP-binding protein [Syntrophaceae bacterium]